MFKSISHFAICVAAASLAACATPSYNYSPEITDISEPPLNTISIAQVGDSMVRQGSYQEREAIQATQPIKFGTIAGYSLTPGHYIKVGQNATGEFFNESEVSGSGRVQVSAMADPFQSLMLKPDGTLCALSAFNISTCAGRAPIRRIKVPIISPDSFQQTLIYSGKVGDKINIGYREFSGNMARPAYNNDVEYDLKQSKTIGYKGAQIDVIEATNQYIKYRVIRNFNRAQ